MRSVPDLFDRRDSARMVLNPSGMIRKALAELQASDGPELGILDLASEARVSADWLYRLDQGQLGRCDLADLERLCRILGRSPNDLLGYEADI